MKCPKCRFDNPEDTNFCGKCAAPLPAAAGPDFRETETIQTSARELTTGSTFAGRYQIIEELGHGGMGRVYKVHDAKTREKIALKLLKPEISSDGEAIERFGNELRLARKISHRNVCRMYDLGDDQGTHFITMEYVSGEDLKSMIRMMGQMSAGKTVYIARQICEGLEEAHKLGVVHRDLKPHNIMIDREGNVRIMDFGIARSLKMKGLTGAGVVIGTPEYMSPEQMEGKEADVRSDVYSLGVILYEMVTGKVPFEGETFVAIALKQKTETPRNPKELNPQLPDDLNRLILRCLERDREKRFQSVEAVLADLAKIEKGVPTTEKVLPLRKPMTSREITVKFRLNKLILPGLILAAVVIGAIFLPTILPHKKGPAAASGKPTLAVVYFENKTGDENLDEWSTGLPELLITDLFQSKFLRVLSSDKIYSVLKKLNLHEAKRYSTEDLVKVAEEGAVEYTISGSYIKAGSQILVNVTLQRPRTEDVVRNLRAECQTFDEITAKVDDLAKQLKAALNLTEKQIASDLDRNLGNITSPNPAALRYYIEAKRYHWRGEYRKAIPLLEKAVALDPEFIRAYEGLSAAHDNLFENAMGNSYQAKVLELIERRPERISERDRYFIEGQQYYFDSSDQFWPRAVEAWNKALEFDPKDSYVNYYLGHLYNNLDQWDKALAYFNVCLDNKFEYVFFYNWMADLFRAKGMPDQARETIEHYLKNVSDTPAGHRVLADHYLSQGKKDLARQELDKAAILDPTHWENSRYTAYLDLLDGDFVQAEKEYGRLLGGTEPTARYMGLVGLFYLYLAEGKFAGSVRLMAQAVEELRKAGEKENECTARRALIYTYLTSGNSGKALEECREAWTRAVELDDLGLQRYFALYRGLAYLGLNNILEAGKAAEELEAINAKGMRKDLDIRMVDRLTGLIELEKKNYGGAIARLKKAVDSLAYGPLEKDARYLDSLALAYFRAGDLDKAQAEYERILALATVRADDGDIYARSIYSLGRIFEKKGDKAKAREHYMKFLDLWKNADPGIPEVEDARKRLAGLK